MNLRKINRRHVLKIGAAALAVAATPLGLKFFSRSHRGKRNLQSAALNVVFITADDLGWKDLSCYGNTNIQTPHLDQLAREGIRFDRAFGVTSSCSSSRATFITGQYISTHGVDGLVHRHLTRQLKPFRRTMPRYLRDNGYHTGTMGKWHVSLLPSEFYGYESAPGSRLIWKRHIKDTRLISEYLEQRANDRRPFYLELNFTDTHRSSNGKFEASPEFAVEPNTIRVPEWTGLPDWPEIRVDLAQYYANLRRMDHLIGETLNALKNNGFENNTLVVFISDNGSPYPGNKMTLLDRGIGTPLIFWLPGKIPSNRVSQALVSAVDVMPTILDLCAVKYENEVEGKSFAALLLNENEEQYREHIFAEMNYHVHHIPMRAVRTERFKLIENLSDEPLGLGDAAKEDWAMKQNRWLEKRPKYELYDLAADPHETKNLAGVSELSEVRDSLRSLLSNWV